MSTAQRDLGFLLADPERRFLRSVAARIPRRWRPNHFTVLGVLGATAAGVAYALSAHSAAWLWVASLALVLQWLGDSLDGNLARVRGTERPKYGYYLDHVVDAYSTVVIGAGIGLSPYVDFGVAMALVIVYLVLSINVYLESSVFGVFRLAYGRIGPTEVRIIMIMANAALALHVWRPFSGPVSLFWVANGVLAVVTLVMLGLLIGRFAGNVRRLAKLEPQRLS